MLSTVKRISVIICISTFFCFFIICCSEPNDNTKHISESLNTNKEQINRSKMKAPIFTPDVSTDTRNIITAFLTAYNCYDGKTAYKYLKTSREEFSIINAYTSVRIPIINIKVSTDDIETLKLEYEMPHPGDILAAILRGGDDIDSIKKNIDTLYSTDDWIKKTETWTIVHSDNRLKIDYFNKGILRFADLLGTNIHSYCNDIEIRRAFDRPFGKSNIPSRIALIISEYFICFNIKTENPEQEIVRKEILTKINGVLGTLTMEIVKPAYTINIPSTWQNLLYIVKDIGKIDQDVAKDIAKVDEDSTIFYTGRMSSGGKAFVMVKRELDARENDEMKNITDSDLLSAYASIDDGKEGRKVIDSGKSKVGGVPAKYFVSIDNITNKPRQRAVNYLFVKNKEVYSLTIGCDEQAFDKNFDQIIKIKDSFRFRKRY